MYPFSLARKIRCHQQKGHRQLHTKLSQVLVGGVSPITPEETKFDLAGEGFLSKEYQSMSLGLVQKHDRHILSECTLS